MGDLTRNISRREIACPCGCGFDTIDFEVVKLLQDLCDFYWQFTPVTLHINSGCRCLDHNRTLPDSDDSSQHIQGRAIDFRIAGIDPSEVRRTLNNLYPNRFGIGEYSSFTHFDTRSDGPARW